MLISDPKGPTQFKTGQLNGPMYMWLMSHDPSIKFNLRCRCELLVFSGLWMSIFVFFKEIDKS